MPQGDEDRETGFADLSRFNQSGGEFALSLYRPVALFTVAVLGTAVAGIRVTIF